MSDVVRHRSEHSDDQGKHIQGNSTLPAPFFSTWLDRLSGNQRRTSTTIDDPLMVENGTNFTPPGLWSHHLADEDPVSPRTSGFTLTLPKFNFDNNSNSGFGGTPCEENIFGLRSGHRRSSNTDALSSAIESNATDINLKEFLHEQQQRHQQGQFHEKEENVDSKEISDVTTQIVGHDETNTSHLRLSEKLNCFPVITRDQIMREEEEEETRVASWNSTEKQDQDLFAMDMESKDDSSSQREPHRNWGFPFQNQEVNKDKVTEMNVWIPQSM